MAHVTEQFASGRAMRAHVKAHLPRFDTGGST